MQPLEWMWDVRNRSRVLIVSGAIAAAIAVVDWWTKPYVSLGFMSIFLLPTLYVWMAGPNDNLPAVDTHETEF